MLLVSRVGEDHDAREMVFRLPPLELLRIALGFTLPVPLIGHDAKTRLAGAVRDALGLRASGCQFLVR
jgi:hypothetical protein